MSVARVLSFNFLTLLFVRSTAFFVPFLFELRRLHAFLHAVADSKVKKTWEIAKRIVMGLKDHGERLDLYMRDLQVRAMKQAMSPLPPARWR